MNTNYNTKHLQKAIPIDIKKNLNLNKQKKIFTFESK